MKMYILGDASFRGEVHYLAVARYLLRLPKYCKNLNIRTFMISFGCVYDVSAVRVYDV
jgi:hypothetical protein